MNFKRTKTRDNIPQIGNIQTKREESTEGILNKEAQTCIKKKSNSRKCELPLTHDTAGVDGAADASREALETDTLHFVHCQ